MRTFGRVLQWIAIGYCVLVVLVAVAVEAALRVQGDGANLAGVWLILVTLPLSTLLSLLPETTGLLASAMLVLTGFVQGGLVWSLGWALRRPAKL